MSEKKKSAWEEVKPAVIKNFCAKRSLSESKLKECSCKDEDCDCGLTAHYGYAVGSIGYAAGDMVGSNE